MEEQDIAEILKIILDSLKDKEFLWRLESSANLKIQGVEVSVNDLDITTDDRGIEIFRNILKKYLVKDFFNKKTNSNSLICEINGFEVEVNSYKDEQLLMLDKTEKRLWNDLQIPVLPLKYAKKFYELINPLTNLVISFMNFSVLFCHKSISIPFILFILPCRIFL